MDWLGSSLAGLCLVLALCSVLVLDFIAGRFVLGVRPSVGRVVSLMVGVGAFVNLDCSIFV